VTIQSSGSEESNHRFHAGACLLARAGEAGRVRRQMDDWASIEAATGWSIPENVRQGCVGPKVVTIPTGRELYAAGPSNKERMNWGAFEENDLGWYLQGNQLDPSWYLSNRAERIALYEYSVVLREPTRAIMSKVAVRCLGCVPRSTAYAAPVEMGPVPKTTADAGVGCIGSVSLASADTGVCVPSSVVSAAAYA
jgi:hypothetical protein